MFFVDIPIFYLAIYVISKSFIAHICPQKNLHFVFLLLAGFSVPSLIRTLWRGHTVPSLIRTLWLGHSVPSLNRTLHRFDDRSLDHLLVKSLFFKRHINLSRVIVYLIVRQSHLFCVRINIFCVIISLEIFFFCSRSFRVRIFFERFIWPKK